MKHIIQVCNPDIKVLTKDEEFEMQADILEICTNQILTFVDRTTTVQAHISLYSSEIPRFFRIEIKYKQKEGRLENAYWEIVKEFPTLKEYQTEIKNHSFI